jgi:hypothetical protein
LAVLPVHQRTGWTLTTHYWVSSLLWSLVLVLIAAGWYLLETAGSGSPPPLVKHPFEFATRVVGLSHHVVALIFLIGVVRWQAVSTWVNLAGLTALGLAGAAAFSHFGGRKNAFLNVGFYVFFQLHAMRDEVRFYRHHSGPTPSLTGAAADRELRWLQMAALGVLGLAIPVWVYSVGLARGSEGSALLALPLKITRRESASVDIFPADWPAAIPALILALPWLALIATAVVRLGGTSSRLRAVAQTHAPLVKVLALGLALVAASAVVGSGALHLLILLHFVGWFQFTMVKLGSAPPVAPPAGGGALLHWLRRTRPGFVVFHGGLAGLVLGLLALDHYVLGAGVTRERSVLTFALSSSTFYSWTILHVAWSFCPRPRPVGGPSSPPRGV